MKIALICDWYRPRIGGIELHLENLAQRLTAAGHDVVVITPTPGDAVVAGVRVVRIDAPLAPRFGFLRSTTGIRAIGEALLRERVDVAHSHVSIVSPAAIGGAAEAERRGVPSVLTFHSVVPQTRLLAHAMRMGLRTEEWRACFTAVSERVAREVRPAAGGQRMAVLPNGIDVGYWRGGRAEDRDGSRSGDGDPSVAALLQDDARVARRHDDGLGSHSERSEESLSTDRDPERPYGSGSGDSDPSVAALLQDDARVARRHDDREPRHPERSEGSLSDDGDPSLAVRLVSVMRLNPKKRPLALVDMMVRVRQSLGSDVDVRLRIAGDGPERRRLERAIARARLSDQIELLGALPRDDVRALLADSDAFVLPTTRESFGIAALEARAAGLPVVAMAASGVAELIAHGREGLLARSDADLADHVALLARDRDRRESIARHNRQNIPMFDWPRVIDAHLAVYREAIALRDSVRAET